MTLMIKVALETQVTLQEEAARKGISMEQVAAAILDETLQEREDLAEAQRRLADGNLDDCYTLDDLRHSLKISRKNPSWQHIPYRQQ